MFENMYKNVVAISGLLLAKICDVSLEILYGSFGFRGNSLPSNNLPSSNKLPTNFDIFREICSSSCDFSCMDYAKYFNDFNNIPVSD